MEKGPTSCSKATVSVWICVHVPIVLLVEINILNLGEIYEMFAANVSEMTADSIELEVSWDISI